MSTAESRCHVVDQLANLHFHFTSVPRCTPMTVEVQRNTDGDTPSSNVVVVVIVDSRR